MKFAVIIATRNRPKMLRQSLQSVVWQTETPAQIIVVDDGDDQTTTQICREVAPDAILLNSGGRGISAANNLGFQQVSADAVAPHGDDDIMLPTRLADHRRTLQGGVDVSYGGWINATPDGDLAFVTGHPNPSLATLLNQGANVAQGAAAYRSELLRRTPYDETLRVGADMDLNARLFDSGAVFAHTETFTVLRRLHPGSMTSRFADEQKRVKAILQDRYRRAPPRDESHGVAKTVSIAWPGFATALATMGFDARDYEFGPEIKTLSEFVAIMRESGAARRLVPCRGEGIVRCLAAVNRDGAKPLQVRYREKFVGVPVRVEHVASDEPDDGTALDALGMAEGGARLLVDIEHVAASGLVAAEEALVQFSPQWRFAARHPLIDLVFDRPIRLALISNRFTNIARVRALLPQVSDAVAAAGASASSPRPEVRAIINDDGVLSQISLDESAA